MTFKISILLQAILLISPVLTFAEDLSLSMSSVALKPGTQAELPLFASAHSQSLSKLSFTLSSSDNGLEIKGMRLASATRGANFNYDRATGIATFIASDADKGFTLRDGPLVFIRLNLSNALTPGTSQNLLITNIESLAISSQSINTNLSLGEITLKNNYFQADINGDGRVDSDDVALLGTLLSANNNNIPSNALSAGDLDYDGKLSRKDLALLRRKIRR